MRYKFLIILFSSFLLLNGASVSAQLIKIDSALISNIKENFVFSNIADEKGVIPIVASECLIKLFNLNDTTVADVKLKYGKSFQKIAKELKWKRDNSTVLGVSLTIDDSSDGIITLKILYGSFICDKQLFKKESLIIFEKNGENKLTCDLKEMVVSQK